MNPPEKEEFLKEFGIRVRKLRLQAELSQEELANLIGYISDNSRSSINKIEAGKSDLPASKVHALAKALGVSVGCLMGWDEFTKAFDTKQLEAEANPLKKQTTADRLKQIMAERGLRQVDILDACKPFCEKYGVKLAKNDLSQYISGKVQPRQAKLSILGMALNVNEVWLMGYNVPAGKDELRDIEQRLKNETTACELFETCHGKDANQAVALFLQLDLLDQGKIIGKMEAMLESEKYSTKEESKHT